MKKLFLISTILSLLFIANGCLIFHSVAYEIKPVQDGAGSAVVTVEDIRTDALNSDELNIDKDNLFKFIYKSDDFVNQMKDEGKKITSRQLQVENGKLNGKIHFNFDDIELVEGIVYEDPYYFLTLAPGDSIISTNGEIIISGEYKRIMWDNSMEVLKFEMFSDKVEAQNLVGMAQYFDQE